MKEIDINIEGFNVNGICVGCLNYKRKMFYDAQVKEVFKIVGDIDVPDGLSIQVCWECLAAVKAVIRFQSKILKSYEILINYSRQHVFLNSPTDLSKYATTNLHIENIVTEPFFPKPCYDEDKVKVKEEISDDKQNLVFEEVPLTPLKNENDDFNEDVSFPEDIQSQEQCSSDDDVILSKLKKKKREKKSKKKEKKKRKEIQNDEEIKNDDSLSKEVDNIKHRKRLKNLPEDLVEVYTMTEEEMWVVRSEDLENKDFQALKYRCDNCILGFHSAKLMNYHMDGKHQPKGDSYQCDVCKAYFLTKENLSTHRSLHTNAYRCLQCQYRSGLKRLMLKHILCHNVSAHECRLCGAQFSTKSKLSYHRAICQRERPQCDCCGKVFANKMTLKYHLKVNPSKEEKVKEKLYIPCKGCDKVFNSKKTYRAHVVIHDGLTYPCPICGKMFQWKRNLARHIRNHREREEGALYECRECRKSFSSRDCYNNHMKLSKKHVHPDAFNHQCSYCGKKFATKWCMVDHVNWEHLKNIRYQCTVCFKAFKTAKILVAHVKNIHEGRKREMEGEHLCEVCGKSYKTVKRLKGHVWAMHTNRSTTKKFTCKLCPATFTWQTSIYKHMKMMHDSNKRNKPSRTIPLKKEEPYPGTELANRMQYFQQNITSNLVHHIVQSGQPVGIVQNLG